jgi:hypothetical protein
MSMQRRSEAACEAGISDDSYYSDGVFPPAESETRAVDAALGHSGSIRRLMPAHPVAI